MLETLGEAALRAALLAGIVQCALSLCRVRQARLLLAIWTVVLAASLTMPLMLRSSPLPIPLDDAVSRTLVDGAADLLFSPLPFHAGEQIDLIRPQHSFSNWLEVAYLVVAGGLAFRVLLGVGLSLFILARAAPIGSGWAARAKVRVSPNVAGPVTIARTIVLPIDAVDWSLETRQAVLAHECAHVGRLDYAMLVVSQLGRAMFWFSPVSWWLHAKLVTLAELASDDQAIELTRNRFRYAEILLDIGQRSGTRARGLSMARPSTLVFRIDRILLDQITPCLVSRPLQIALTLGLTGISLAVANLAFVIVTRPALPVLSDMFFQDVPVQELSPTLSVEATSRSETTLETTPIAIPFIAKPLPVKAPTRPRLAASTKPSVRTRPGGELTSKLADNDIGPKPLPDITLPQTRSTLASLAVSRAIERSATPTNTMASGFGSFVGNACEGTITIGMRANSYLLPSEPRVAGGQKAHAKAQFFQKADGSSWIRFNAFDRPALDLPVRPTRNGVTWTGEYGIAYAVQTSAGNHLIGLAARVANDSAALEFTCIRSPLLKE